MSKAYKCDRCGDFFEPGDQGEIKNSPYGVWKGNSSADLCPACRDELHKWYTEPDKSKPVDYWMSRVTEAAREAYERLKDTDEFKATVKAAEERARAEMDGDAENG